MKLNNRGWGLGVFLMFLLMFFIILLIVANLVSNVNDRFIENDYVYKVEK